MNTVMKQAASQVDQHRRAVKLNPRDANAHALLGLALLNQREVEEGVAALRRALELNPKVRGLHGVLAAALFELGQFEAAAEYYRKALGFQDDADLHQGLADALMRLGRQEEAEGPARRAAELDPGNSATLLSLAAVLHGQRRRPEAIAVLQQVLALEPDNVDVRYDLGDQLFRNKQYAEAADYFKEVISRVPEHAKALRYLGASQFHIGELEPAIATLERALALMPDDAETMTDLGAVLQARGNLSAAKPLLERAHELAPENPNTLGALSHVYFGLGDWESSLRSARKLLAVDPSPAAHSMQLFILSHCCLDGDELTREHFSFGERWEAPLRQHWQAHANDRNPLRPLRVGLVSADLFNHAVSRFIAPVLEAFKDSKQVAIHAYYNNTIEDAMMRAQRDCVAKWDCIANMDDEEAAQLIRDDRIDILIDLSGHSSKNRLPLFALKPAPIQATWIGYAGTTGMESMDYILCDRFMVPKGRYDHQFSEKIVRLPLGAPFLPENHAPEVNPLPALKNGYLTFGSFHRASKLSRQVIAQWARLLHAIPDSKMLLGGMQPGIDDVLIDWFVAEGIPRERLLLRERATVYEYLKQHHDVDVCLCPFPYTGSTTIGHALWMGVPTLATVGTTNPSHAATSFMAHLGLDTFITENEETYVKLGTFLADNVSALAAMRGTMRDRFLKSVLGYPGVASAGLELALRRMWQRWCEGQEPAALEVTLADIVAHAKQEQAAGQ